MQTKTRVLMAEGRTPRQTQGEVIQGEGQHEKGRQPRTGPWTNPNFSVMGKREGVAKETLPQESRAPLQNEGTNHRTGWLRQVKWLSPRGRAFTQQQRGCQ